MSTIIKVDVGDTLHIPTNRADHVAAVVDCVFPDGSVSGRSTADGGKTWWVWSRQHFHNTQWVKLPNGVDDIWPAYVAWTLTHD